MRILHIALGGCLQAPPVRYGLTEDTGGHIAYVLGAAMAQARLPDVTAVDIVTRAFHDDELGAIFAQTEEHINPKVRILRLETANREYLSKDRLAAEIDAIGEAFCTRLSQLPALPDVIHAHFADAARIARLASRRFGIPWVYTPHSLGLEKADCDRTSVRVRDERRAIADANAIIVSSRDEAERQLMAYDEGAAGRIHRIAPGVTLQKSDGGRLGAQLIAPFIRDAEKPIVLAVARPVRKKNLAALVRAFGTNDRLKERANLVILAGLRRSIDEGPEEQVAVHQELMRLIDTHDLWGKVALPRSHTAADVRSLYDLAASKGVFANPAYHEPFGLTVVEAAQAGAPVVATASGGPSSIISDIGYGTLVDPSDPADLAAKILSLLDDPRREDNRLKAQERALSLYQWSRWAGEILKVYREIREDKRISRLQVARVLACDVDGTLTGDRPAAAAFSNWSRNRSDTCTLIATGRSISEARRVVAAWGLPCPEVLVTSVGSEIWRCVGRGDYRLCPDFAETISAGWERDDIFAAIDALKVKPQPRHDQRRWKLSYLGDGQDARRINDRLRQKRLPARVIFSHGDMIDVLPEKAGKAAAIAFEARRLNLTLGDCIAAGDSGNDLDMLTACGTAILPANARDGIAEKLRGRAYQSRYNYAAGVLDGLTAIYGAQDGKGSRHA